MPDKITSNYTFQESEISLRALFSIVMKSKWIVLSVTSVMVAIGVIITIWQIPVYQSQTMLVLDQDQQGISVFDIGLGGSNTNITDELQLLKSRTLIESALNKLWSSEFGKDMYLLGTRVYSPTGIRRATREFFTLGFWTNQLAIDHNPNEVPPDSLMRSAIKQIQMELNVSNPSGSNIINIRYDSFEPEEAALVINTLVENFILQEQQWDSGEGTHMRLFLESQLSSIVTELNNLEKELKEYQEQEQIFGLEDEAGILMRELASIEATYYAQLAKVNIAREKKRYVLENIASSDTTLAKDLTNSVNNQLFALRQEIASSEANLVRNSSLYGESHEALISTKEKIRKLKLQLVHQTNELLLQGLNVSDPLGFRQSLVDTVIVLEGAVQGLEGAANEYKKLLDQYSDQLRALPEKSLQYFRLEREQYVLAETYKFLRQKLEEARLNEASALSNIRVVDPAIPFYKPIKPKPLNNILLFTILGFVLGSGLVIWRQLSTGDLKK
ncbi:GumC family protein [Candidatus Neomarinimicrobiota bacterium]